MGKIRIISFNEFLRFQDFVDIIKNCCRTYIYLIAVKCTENVGELKTNWADIIHSFKNATKPTNTRRLWTVAFV